MGEAVGINKIIKKYNSQFVEELRGCEIRLFEKAIEKLIKKEIPIYPIDIKSSLCIEVDFKEDLELINQKIL